MNFLDKHGGLKGLRVVFFITCLAASEKIPAFIRKPVINRYLSIISSHIRGDILAHKVFRGWIAKPGRRVLEVVLEECREWCESIFHLVNQ